MPGGVAGVPPMEAPYADRARTEVGDFYCVDIIHARLKVVETFAKQSRK